MKKLVKRSAALLFAVMILSSMLMIPAQAANNEIAQPGYYDDGGTGNPHSMPIYSTYPLYFQFRGDDIQSLSVFVNSNYGSANCGFHDMVWKPYEAQDNICEGWLDITPTSYGRFGVFILVYDSAGNVSTYCKFNLNVY